MKLFRILAVQRLDTGCAEEEEERCAEMYTKRLRRYCKVLLRERKENDWMQILNSITEDKSYAKTKTKALDNI